MAGTVSMVDLVSVLSLDQRLLAPMVWGAEEREGR